MTTTLIGVLVLLAGAFLALMLVRVLGARRKMVGLGWILAGLALMAGGLFLRLWVAAAAGAGCFAFGLWLRRRAWARVGPAASSADAQARAAANLIGVAIDAPEAAIQAAFRKAMAHAHPDAGGSAEQVRALVEARDLLLHRNKTLQRE